MARLAIARRFLAEYAQLDRGVRTAVQAVITEFASSGDAGQYQERSRGSWMTGSESSRWTACGAASCWSFRAGTHTA